MKKKNHDIRDLVYIHLNEKEQYVITHGIDFFEFARAQLERMNSLLLLKHRFHDGEFNMHTMFEYVPKENLKKLIEEDVYSYGDFCWIDFEEAETLNELPGQMIAELLFLSHVKEHLRKPFYNYLNNRYVYLAHEDGWFNKTYYRDFQDFYQMLGETIAVKLSQLKAEKSLLGLKKKRSYPSVPSEVLMALRPFMKEGIVLSMKYCTQNRSRIEIPLWTIGDFANMDDMYEEFETEYAKKPCEAKLVIDKKTKEWRLYSS